MFPWILAVTAGVVVLLVVMWTLIFKEPHLAMARICHAKFGGNLAKIENGVVVVISIVALAFGLFLLGVVYHMTMVKEEWVDHAGYQTFLEEAKRVSPRGKRPVFIPSSYFIGSIHCHTPINESACSAFREKYRQHVVSAMEKVTMSNSL